VGVVVFAVHPLSLSRVVLCGDRVVFARYTLTHGKEQRAMYLYVLFSRILRTPYLLGREKVVLSSLLPRVTLLHIESSPVRQVFCFAASICPHSLGRQTQLLFSLSPFPLSFSTTHKRFLCLLFASLDMPTGLK